MKNQTDDLRIKEMKEVSPPSQVHSEFPLSDDSSKCVYEARGDIQNILKGEDDRLAGEAPDEAVPRAIVAEGGPDEMDGDREPGDRKCQTAGQPARQAFQSIHRSVRAQMVERDGITLQ